MVFLLLYGLRLSFAHSEVWAGCVLGLFTVSTDYEMCLLLLAPNEKMQQVIKKTIEEAKALISKVSFLK